MKLSLYRVVGCLASLSMALLSACNPPAAPPLALTSTATLLPMPTPLDPTSTATSAPVPTITPIPSPVPTIESLKATVTTGISNGLLSCNYGPGPDYLFLYALREGANIVLIGRTDQVNWHWVYVLGKSPCWVNTKFLDVHGEWQRLPIVYPGVAKLPVSPYYPPTTVLRATRQGDQITINWLDIPLRAGDEEDASMPHYIVEVWRCQGGQLLFEPLATNESSVTFADQPGCAAASHGRVFVQEKHGFAGPAEIPWPAP